MPFYIDYLKALKVLFLVSPYIVQEFMVDTSIKRTWQQLKVE